MKLTRVKLDPRTWRRGKASKHTKLLMCKTPQKCCIGFLALKLGATEQEIKGKSTLYASISNSTDCQNFAKTQFSFLSDAYEINDMKIKKEIKSPDKHRVRLLNKAAAKYGALVRFSLGR